MIDNFAIFFTTAATVYIIWRAARLDRKLPWFSKPSDGDREERASGADAARWSGARSRPPAAPWRR